MTAAHWLAYAVVAVFTIAGFMAGYIAGTIVGYRQAMRRAGDMIRELRADLFPTAVQRAMDHAHQEEDDNA